MKLAAVVGLLVSAASCSHARAPGQTKGPPDAGPDYCSMAAVALTEAIKSNREQPYGLEAACVDEMATAAGKIYVDARFIQVPDGGTVAATSCVRKNYVIRFDPSHFEPSPARGVVLLLVSAPTPNGREFNARMETPNWPANPPGTVALSQCGSAFGVLTGSGSSWKGQINPPPRGPDDL